MGVWFYFSRDLELLAVLLCNMAKFLGEEGYMDHYMRDFPSLLKEVVFHESQSTKSPPSLFRWLEACLLQGCGSADINELPLLVRTGGSSIVSHARKIVSFFCLLCGGQQDEKDLSSGVFCNVAVGSYSTNEEHTVLAMVGERFGLRQLDCLPPGVSLPLRHVSTMISLYCGLSAVLHWRNWFFAVVVGSISQNSLLDEEMYREYVYKGGWAGVGRISYLGSCQ